MSLLTMTGAGVATLGFQPNSIAGLVGWWKADAGTSTSVDGAAISLWADQSGNNVNLVQATGSLQPTYKASSFNARPAVRYDGVDDSLTASSNPLSVAEMTIFIVCQITGGANEKTPIYTTDDRLRLRGSTSIWILKDNGGSLVILNSGSFAAATVKCLVASSTVMTTFSNGTQQDTNTTTHLAPAGSFVVGRMSPHEMAGDIAEVVVYNSALSTSDRRSVESYLGIKYGITVA